MQSTIQRSVAKLLIASTLAVGLATPGQAEVVRTAAVTDRERIAMELEREEVRTRLASHGVDPATAKARVAALTDAEAAQLAAMMDALPAGAGGGGGGAAAFAGVVLIAVFIKVVLPVVLIAVAVVAVARSINASRSDP